MVKKLSYDELQGEPNHIQLHHNIFIIWDPKFDLGIPIIDEQHRGIVTTINSLHFGIRNHYIENTFAPIVSMMSEYTRIHFKIEEAFLEKIDYSQVQRHRELHDELLEELIFFGRQSLLNKEPQQFMHFLKNWWITHICQEDLLYRNYLLSR